MYKCIFVVIFPKKDFWKKNVHFKRKKKKVFIFFFITDYQLVTSSIFITNHFNSFFCFFFHLIFKPNKIYMFTYTIQRSEKWLCTHTFTHVQTLTAWKRKGFTHYVRGIYNNTKRKAFIQHGFDIVTANHSKRAGGKLYEVNFY